MISNEFLKPKEALRVSRAVTRSPPYQSRPQVNRPPESNAPLDFASPVGKNEVLRVYPALGLAWLCFASLCIASPHLASPCLTLPCLCYPNWADLGLILGGLGGQNRAVAAAALVF